MNNSSLTELVRRMPQCVRTVCIYPDGPAGLDALLKQEGIDVCSPESQVDVHLVFQAGENEYWLPILRTALSTADPNVFFYMAPRPGEVVDAALQALGLEAYPARRPRDLSRYTLISIHEKSEDPLLGEGSLYVRKGYDPLEHARALAERGHPDWAFDILDLIPEARLTDPVQQLLIALEKQIDLLMMQAAAPTDNKLRLFFLGQREFYRILSLQPTNPTAHICQAEAWRYIGRADIAHDLLTSFQEHCPDPAATHRLAQLGDRPVVEFPEVPVYPPCSPGFRPRLLLLNHVNSDVGFDALYDGLCRILGAENVVEYPWKHYLHGGVIDGNIHHPAMCDYPGAPVPLEELEHQLRAGRFAVVVYADTFQLSDTTELERLVYANLNIPVVLLDQQDEGWDNTPRILREFPQAKVLGQFKREKLQGQVYSPGTVPLPLTYMEGHAAPVFVRERSHGIFWAGHRHFGLRRLYVGAVESSQGLDLNQQYPPAEYTTLLDASRIGLDIFGFGYDTIRYWELPAHGCMLLTERKPLVIPHEFESGKHAVYFSTLGELKEKLAYYLSHPEEALRIAEAGYHHYWRYHTATERARQFLGQIEYWLAAPER